MFGARDGALRFEEVPARRVRAGGVQASLRRINFIYGERDRLPDAKPRLVGSKLVLAAKLIGMVAVAAGYLYGLPYVACRQMKDRGMFYYGTTVATCVQERMVEQADNLDALKRTLFPNPRS